MHRELLDQLNAETTLAKTMAKALDDERDALANSDIGQIDHISQTKRSLLEKLETHARARLQLVTSMGYRRESGTVRQFLAQKDPSQALLQNWDRLNRQLQLCSDKNQVNGRIISLSQRKTEMALNVLRGQLPKNNSAYNRLGKMTHHQCGSSISSA